MLLRKPQASKTGSVGSRPASPDTTREDADPARPGGESKQPYASELDDYHGEKVKPPREKPETADG